MSSEHEAWLYADLPGDPASELGIGDAWFLAGVKTRETVQAVLRSGSARLRQGCAQAGLCLGRGAALWNGNADAFESFDHFVGGFGAEILDFQQILIAEAHQIRHGVDLSTLEAVVGTN